MDTAASESVPVTISSEIVSKVLNSLHVPELRVLAKAIGYGFPVHTMRRPTLMNAISLIVDASLGEFGNGTLRFDGKFLRGSRQVRPQTLSAFGLVRPPTPPPAASLPLVVEREPTHPHLRNMTMNSVAQMLPFYGLTDALSFRVFHHQIMTPQIVTMNRIRHLLMSDPTKRLLVSFWHPSHTGVLRSSSLLASNPMTFVVKFGGVEMKSRGGTALPVDVSHMLFGTEDPTCEILSTTPGNKAYTLHMIFFLCTFDDKSACGLVEHFVHRNNLMNPAHHSTPVLGTDIDEVEVDALTVPLDCPYTLTRMHTPVRGLACRHVQCFDMASFFTANHSLAVPTWKCPVCSETTFPKDLRVDHIVQEAVSAPWLENDTHILVDPRYTRWGRVQDGLPPPLQPDVVAGYETSDDSRTAIDFWLGGEAAEISTDADSHSSVDHEKFWLGEAAEDFPPPQPTMASMMAYAAADDLQHSGEFLNEKLCSMCSSALITTGDDQEAYEGDGVLKQKQPIIIVGVDGLSARGCWRSKTFGQIVKRSAYTYRARAGEHTRSYEGWQAMFKGGYDYGMEVTYDSNVKPRLFQYIKHKAPHKKLWLIYRYYIVRKSVGEEYADFYEYETTAPKAVNRFLQHLDPKHPPDLTVLYFLDVDSAGHGNGWDSSHYDETVDMVGQQILRVHAAVPNARMYIVSDHGGRGGGHMYTGRNMKSDDANIDSVVHRDVPFIIFPDPDPRPLCDIIHNDELVAEVAQAMNISVHPSWRTRGGWLPRSFPCTAKDVAPRYTGAAGKVSPENIKWGALALLVMLALYP